MKTLNVNTKLAYKKTSVLELNENQLSQVKGGTIVPTSSITITITTTSSVTFIKLKKIG